MTNEQACPGANDTSTLHAALTNWAGLRGEKVPARDLQARGLYDGAELQTYEGRPGAMDAFRLPSLHMGTRTWRRA